MRILWLASNGGLYKSNELSGTGSWIPALQKSICSVEGLELGITFLHQTDSQPLHEGNVSYYPIKVKQRGRLGSLVTRWCNEDDTPSYLQKMKEVVEDFQPDIIHIWGVENFYALLAGMVNVPCIAHVQGLISSYINHYLPPAFSEQDIKQTDSVKNRLLKQGNWQAYRSFCKRLKNEKEAISHIRYYIGRTDWDHNTIMMQRPDAKYFHCDEMMRPCFYEGQWQYHYNGKLVIQSTVSVMFYKGLDVILKTAKVLKDGNVDFVWNVYGMNGKEPIVKLFSKKLRIIPSDNNITFCGSAPQEVIKESLLKSDVYVHPAYIENSSNAICEAMLLGIPVIAQNMGGTSSIIPEGSGVLVPVNEPIQLAYQITRMKEKELAGSLSNEAIRIAKRRQNKNLILSDLVDIYKQMSSLEL